MAATFLDRHASPGGPQPAPTAAQLAVTSLFKENTPQERLVGPDAG